MVVLSNCEVRDCGGVGVRAEEGSTLNLLNCQVGGWSTVRWVAGQVSGGWLGLWKVIWVNAQWELMPVVGSDGQI